MFLIAKLGYKSWAIDLTDSAAPLLVQALQKAIPVKEEGPYDKRIWVLEKDNDAKIEFSIISDSNVEISEKMRSDNEIIVKLSRRQHEEEMKVYALREQLKKAVCSMKDANVDVSAFVNTETNEPLF